MAAVKQGRNFLAAELDLKGKSPKNNNLLTVPLNTHEGEI